MSRYLIAILIVAAVALAACSAAANAPSQAPLPTASPAVPSAAPTITPPVSTPLPTTTPKPASPEPTARPQPTPVAFTAKERYLRDGVIRGAVDCKPVTGSGELPPAAIAGIECRSDDRGVARIGFYLFKDDADMLRAYTARMSEEGVALESGNCRDGEHESAYTPGEGIVPARHGCFINDAGYANYRATLPWVHVYIGILGATDNMPYLEDFAWNGNTDTPGGPTLWGDPS
jgi:hypothetical protein